MHNISIIPIIFFPIPFRRRKMYEKIDEYAENNIDCGKDDSINMTYDVDMPCLVKARKSEADDKVFYFCRGKIVDISFDVKCELEVFLVDTGRTVKVESTDVFQIPEDLHETFAYQVWIHSSGVSTTQYK